MLKRLVEDGIATGWGPDALMRPAERSGKIRRLTNCRSLGFDVFLCDTERGHLIARARLIMDEISRYAKRCQGDLEALLPVRDPDD